MLITENVRWDEENRMEDTIDEYLELLCDEKPITIRQCIQSLGKFVQYKPNLNEKIVKRLIAFDIMSVKETMRKPILLDIIAVLLTVRKEQKTDEADVFIHNALMGEILDKKSKKHIEVELERQL